MPNFWMRCVSGSGHNHSTPRRLAHGPMVVTAGGISTDLRQLHPPNAWYPILVTEFGIFTEARERQSLKAHEPTDETELGIWTSFTEVQ